METEQTFPSYSRPPLDEVAADMQFTSLPLKAADIGAFHALIAADYPRTLDVPTLPPSFEPVGPGFVLPFGIGIGIGADLPRSWFISEDDEHVVQLQPDRLIVNWRMRPHGGPYPRYAEVRRRFVAAHEALATFVHQKGYPDTVPNQCDLTYFNKVPLPANAEWGDIHCLLRGMQLNTGPEWSGPFDNCQMALRRRLRSHPEGAFGRLQVECVPIQIDVTQKAWALNVTVKGRPASADFQAVLDFFDIAHVEIVTCFTAITTEAMHELWGRQR
jgi:uncharacterized protein (TIGR04255 family)